MFHRPRLLVAALNLSLVLLLTACQSLPLKGQLPESLTVEEITAVAPNSPFAISSDGTVAALVNSGLKLFHLPTKQQLPLANTPADKLSWSPLGYSLAATFPEGQKTRVVIYDQFGTKTTETVIDAQITDIGWLSEDELGLGGIIVKHYSFGSNYSSMLYRWRPGENLPVARELRDSTLQPATMRKWQGYLARGPMMDFSRQTPLISFVHPVEPPLFPPYYKLIVMDLASGRQIETASVSLASDGPRLSADGERVLYADGNGSIILKNPWSDEVLQTTKGLGFKPALSPDSDVWFADGALVRQGTLVTPLAPGATAQFTRNGSSLAIVSGTELYLLRGLKPASGSMFLPELNDKLQKLRSLRAEGLITSQEYKEALERIGKP